MRARTALAAGLVLVACVGSLSPALAKGKTVTKEYDASAPVPDPANYALGNCDGSVPMSKYEETFKAPFTGRLTVLMNGFQGDWDLGLFEDGALAADSAQAATDPIDTPEHVDGFKMKKGESVVIRSCNFSGGPTAHMKYTFK
ncbi:MAG: hypothetical protein JWO88_943 [Frankiales bacterium]|nr:hypothetical protein [Frankiales bacterium]